MDEINIYNTGYGSNSVYGGFVSVDRLLTQTWNANLWGGTYLEFQADDNGQNTSSKLVETTNGVKPGIAITGVEIWTADGNNGKFWYKFDPDGERYEVKISDLSKSNALVLPADAYVSFPSGLELGVNGYGWDGTNYKAGSFVDITASTDAPGQFSSNSVNISVTTWKDSDESLGTGGVMQGSDDADELFGSQFNDFIFDWDGDDRIYAGDGDDIIRSGRGSDYFDGGSPDPNNPGGAGLDTSINDTFLIDFGFNNQRDYIEVILGDGTYYIDDEGNRTKSDEIRNIEHLQIVAMEGNMLLVGDEESNIISGSYGNDVLAGEAGDDVLFGGWGSDLLYDWEGQNILIGGRGEDFAVFGFDREFNKTSIGHIEYALTNEAPGVAGYRVRADNVRAGIDNDAVIYEVRMFDTSDSLIGTNYLIDIEGVVGTDGNDVYNGDDTSLNRLHRVYNENEVHLNALGQADENYEAFAPGLGDDVITGGSGYTELNYAFGSDSSRSVNVNLDTGIATISDSGNTYTDTFTSVEGVEGSNGDDFIYGDESANSLDGRKGNDFIDGGDGFDYVEYNGGPNAVTVDLNVGVAVDQWGSTDRLYNIEGVVGSGHNDVFYDSTSQDNAYFGKQGFDTLIYHEAFDAFDFKKISNELFHITNIASATTDIVDNIERIKFSDVTINLEAYGPSGPMELVKLGEQDDVVYGDAANQYVISAGGDDEINAGSGDDFIQIDSTSADDHIVVRAGLGSDTVWVNEAFSGTLELHADPDDSSENSNFDIIEFEGEVVDARFDNGDIILNTASGGQIKLMNQLELVDSQWVTNQSYGFDFIREYGDDGKGHFLNPVAANDDYLATDYPVVVFGSNQDDEIDIGWNDYQSSVSILGFDGNDILFSSKFDDTIHGGDGHDDIAGDMGDDYLEGGRGDDFLSGQEGLDWLIGGSGDDGYNIKFQTEMFLDRDQSDQTNFDLLSGDNVDRIVDTSGENDWIGLNVRNGAPSSYTPITHENPFSLNASVQIVDGSLKFVSRIDDSFSFGPYVETGWLDGWYWRDENDKVFDESEDHYTRGFTQDEEEAFSLYDLTTYPGWSGLSGAEQSFFEGLLDPKSEGFVDTLKAITDLYYNAYDHNTGETNLNYDPSADLALAYLPDAVDPPLVDYENSNVPELLVLKAVYENIVSVDSIQGFETGFQIENFANADDTIESLFVYDDFGFNSAITEIVNELGPSGKIETVTDIKDEALKRGIGKEFNFDNTGMVTSDQSGDFILVAGNYQNRYSLNTYKDVYVNTGSQGELTFEVSQEGYDAASDQWLSYQGDGMLLSSAPEIIQHHESEIVVGGSGSDIIYGRENKFYDSNLESNPMDFLVGEGGSDQFYLYGGENLAIGGVGDDVFVVRGKVQDTEIYGDLLHADINDMGINTNYADKVYIDWVYDADSIAEISGTNGQGVVVWNDELGARVEIYDAEELIFRSATDPTQWDAGISIGETAVVGIGTDPDDPLSWMNGHHGKSFSYAGNNVRFVLTDKPAEDGGPAATLNGDASSDWLQVYATVTTTEKYTYYQHKNGKKRNSPARGYTKKTGTRDVEEEALIWEGDRAAVGKFDFEDIDIQVINVQEQDAFGDPILYTSGTENTDLIFGNQYANIIDGGGGDDIIFGGGGDDVLIGGEGDDVITGGEGDDIIRGDSIESDDAAYEAISAMAETLAELAAEEDPNTDIGQVVNDTLNDFSVGTGNDGNDTILGGDGVDDIDSGDGENFVTSGRLELVNEGETDLETLNEHIKSHKDIFDDDDWI